MNRKDNKLVFREGPIAGGPNGVLPEVFPVERMDNAGGVDLVMSGIDRGDDGTQDAETIEINFQTQNDGGGWATALVLFDGTVAELKTAFNEHYEFFRVGLRRKLGQDNRILFNYGGSDLDDLDLIVFLEPEV